ncbi:MAG: DUF3179 domain-containing protein [Gemmatimonadota bacterium]
MRPRIDRRAGALVRAAPWIALLAHVAPASGQSRDIRRLAGRDAWRTDFTRASVPLAEVVSGGPSKDGIPAIDRPRFEGVDAADRWLGKRDPVVVIEADGRVKAYPLGILIWHEIVNDQVGDLPVAVTFCPLCNTALAFDRRLDGRVLDFGTTGRLRHSDLVMYDRQTETWWQQAVGEAIIGELTGARLTLLAANTLAWSEVKRLYPGARVLSRDTGFPRLRSRYGHNPYVGYDRPNGRPWRRFFGAKLDPQRPAMERVVDVDVGPGWAAPFGELRDARVANAEVEGSRFAVFWAPGAASATDDERISNGRDVGQAAVFDRELEGRELDFVWKDGAFRDEQTGSTWDLAGRATSGPLAGKRLRPVAHGTHFWFAWVVFRPETEVWTS